MKHCLLWIALILCSSGLLGACAKAPPEPQTTFNPSRLVDLSHVIRTDVPYLAAEPFTLIERDDGGRAVALSLGLRTGTLVRNFDETAPTLDQLSPRDMMLPAVALDLRARADEPGWNLEVADLVAWEAAHGQIPSEALVLINTGRDMLWGNPQSYLAERPWINPAALEFLAEREISAIGIDASLAETSPTEGSWLLLENLTNLEQLPPTGAVVVIGALRLQAGHASPARVLAMIP